MCSRHSKGVLFAFMKVKLHYLSYNYDFYLLNGISHTDIPRNLPIVKLEIIVKFIPNIIFFYSEHRVI